MSKEITLNSIQSNSQLIDEASNDFLLCFGPEFTETPRGHIATDIAGASTIAGLMLLRSTSIDLSKYEPGNVILSEEINQKQDPVFRYIAAIGQNMGVDPNSDFNQGDIDGNESLFDTVKLTQKLENTFYKACAKSGIQELYYPIVAALTAMKLVGAGKDMGLLDPSIGKNIAIFNIVSGSKTVPYNNQ